MRNVVKVAARNVTANKKRTLITIVTITIGLCAINIGKGLISGMQRESKLNVTEGRTGEIQIHKQGFLDANELTTLDYSIDNYSGLRDELKEIEGIRHLSGRIQFGGLLAKEDETTVVFCRAADIENEIKVCPRIKENIIEGRFLTRDDTNGAVIASGLKNGLGVNLGESVIIVANTEDGYQNAVEVTVVGVIEEKTAQANKRLVYMPIRVARELLYMEDKVTEIAIKTDGGGDIDLLNDRLNSLLKGRSLESNTWKDVSAFFVDVMKKQNVVIFALCVIFYFIVVSSITNTMTLTVFERKKEIGTMMAIGIKAKEIIRLLVTESMIIGLLGSLSGIAISAVIIMILGRAGLTRTPPESTAPITIYPFISRPFMLLSFFLGILSSVAASVYPAGKVLRLNPVDALRST